MIPICCLFFYFYLPTVTTSAGSFSHQLQYLFLNFFSWPSLSCIMCYGEHNTSRLLVLIWEKFTTLQDREQLRCKGVLHPQMHITHLDCTCAVQEHQCACAKIAHAQWCPQSPLRDSQHTSPSEERRDTSLHVWSSLRTQRSAGAWGMKHPHPLSGGDTLLWGSIKLAQCVIQLGPHQSHKPSNTPSGEKYYDATAFLGLPIFPWNQMLLFKCPIRQWEAQGSPLGCGHGGRMLWILRSVGPPFCSCIPIDIQTPLIFPLWFCLFSWGLIPAHQLKIQWKKGENHQLPHHDLRNRIPEHPPWI